MNLPSRAAHGVLKKDVELGVKLSNFGNLCFCARFVEAWKKMVSKRLKVRLGFSFFDIRAKNQEHTS